MQSNLSPRERVLTALAHQQPDRVPFSWGFGPTPEMAQALETALAGQGCNWARLRLAVEHIRYIGAPYTGPELPPHTDIWGIGYTPVSYGTGAYDEFSHQPLAGIETVAAIDAHPWPTADWYDYTAIRALADTDDPQRRLAKKVFAGNPFEIYCWMTGLEESMVNLLVQPEVVVAALGHITDFFATRLRRTLEVAGDLVDIVFMADDLGSQQGLLISHTAYRDILQPFHRQMTAVVRGLAPQAKVMFHSDGAVFDLLPDLLDAGIDILEAVQTDAAGMDPARLKDTFGNRLAYHGGISVQRLLPHGNPAEVAAGCRHLVATLGARGGYIAAPAHAIQAGTPVENVLTMLRTVLGEKAFAEAWDAALAQSPVG